MGRIEGGGYLVITIKRIHGVVGESRLQIISAWQSKVLEVEALASTSLIPFSIGVPNICALCCSTLRYREL
jgi:hypothetical protein